MRRPTIEEQRALATLAREAFNWLDRIQFEGDDKALRAMLRTHPGIEGDFIRKGKELLARCDWF
jgi:hypothetical protein